jgi:ubiquitin-like modifier-activating enzyme ATG7
MSDLVKQSLYIDKDCGVPRVSAIAPHLKERCPAVVRTVFSLKHMLMNFYCIWMVVISVMKEVESIQLEIPMPGHPVSSSKMASVLDDCKHLQTLVAANDAVFFLTDTWESRWLPTLLCSSENKVMLEHIIYWLRTFSAVLVQQCLSS